MIDPSVIEPRTPRLGTITTGRGVAATSSKGRSYNRPTRTDCFVVHTDVEQAAAAVADRFDGTTMRDSDTWDFDVLVPARTIPVHVLVPQFRQAMELWTAGQCHRRCDGVTASHVRGVGEGVPCVCDSGAARECSPTTVMPVLLDLGLPMLGTWEVRSSSYGTAGNLSGTIRMLTSTVRAGAVVPADLSLQDRKVRDSEGRVWDTVEMLLYPTVGLDGLAGALDAPAGGRGLPAPDRDRDVLMARWSRLLESVDDVTRGRLQAAWRSQGHGATQVGDLDIPDLLAWVEQADRLVHADTPAVAAVASSDVEGVSGQADGPDAADGNVARPECGVCGGSGADADGIACRDCGGWGE